MFVKLIGIFEISLAILSLIVWLTGIYFVCQAEFIISMACFLLFAWLIYASGKIGDFRIFVSRRQGRDDDASF